MDICLADLPNDPCAKKIQPDVDKCLLAKVPDYDPDNTNPKYYCCITWIANDCYESVGKTKCSSSELKTMDQLLSNMKKVRTSWLLSIKDLTVRPTDIWICGYHKSGNTRHQFILQMTINNPGLRHSLMYGSVPDSVDHSVGHY
ncbi:unnamed protein product [Medioppia subpectinata]|uniref:Uncharacterized protein n=1 Tax=Medioppia subpectinata TaxID=1979941 RepID=A0A7R9PZ65_9ACAR|nr:unnamed protein product [Medioppia subpectinata]CAG2106651.1 unnamed protein product [Medioppia subpectinata]